METVTLRASEADAGERLDAWLCAQLEELTRSAAARLCTQGQVTAGGKPLAKNYRLNGTETVEVTLPEPEILDAVPQDIPLDVVYEDADVIVVNKPKGLVVHPAPGHPDGTLVNALLHHCGDSLSGIGGELRPGIVHRIDRDTSGLLIAAKNDFAHQKLAAQLQEVLSALLPQRREAAADFARQLEEELRQLGFSEQVRVIPDFMPQEVWPGLMDEKVRILWAPNPGQAPQPLDRIASGGELSRFLLALMSVRPKAESATYIFDEVDAGVGGLTLNKLAEKLENLAKQRQMLVITHWPQLAARAQKHFQISKTIRDNATFTTCVPLDARQRHAELVRMAGGGQQGEALTASLEGRSYQLTMF